MTVVKPPGKEGKRVVWETAPQVLARALAPVLLRSFTGVVGCLNMGRQHGETTPREIRFRPGVIRHQVPPKSIYLLPARLPLRRVLRREFLACEQDRALFGHRPLASRAPWLAISRH